VDNGPAGEVIGRLGGILVSANSNSIAAGIQTIIRSPKAYSPAQVQKYAQTRYQATIQVAKVTKVIKNALLLHY
jgi:hypothetical protein